MIKELTMSTTPDKFINLPVQEANQRLDSLVLELGIFLAAKAELTDIVLDALLNTYLKVAISTGRIHDVPTALNQMATRVSQFVASAQAPTNYH